MKMGIKQAREILEDRIATDRGMRNNKVESDFDEFCERECQAIETLLNTAITYTIYPTGVCCKKMVLTIGTPTDNDGYYYLLDIAFTGGCAGNLSALRLTMIGKRLVDIAEMFHGNTCGKKNTSCMNELAKGIYNFLLSEKDEK